MNLLSSWLLPWNPLVLCWNAAVASCVACGIALILNRRSRWSLPVRHALLAVALAASLTVPLLIPLLGLPSLCAISISAQAQRPSPKASRSTSKSSHGEPPMELSATTTNPVSGVHSEMPIRVPKSHTISPVVPVSDPPGPPSSIQRSAMTVSWARIVGTLLCGLWIGGSIVELARAIIDRVRLHRWLQTVTIADSPQLKAVICPAASNVGLRGPVTIYCSVPLPSPITFGLLHPRIVLPKDIESSLSADQLRAVIQHEMAHVIRKDLWIGLLQQAALIAYWWNPLVRVTSRCLADSREQICDDIAIRELPEPSTYAATLISLAERCSLSVPVPASLGIGSSPVSQLEDRIRRILSSSESRSSRLTRPAAVGVLATVVLMTTTILLAQVQVKSTSDSRLAERPESDVQTSPPPRLTNSPAVEEKRQSTVSNLEAAEEPDPSEHPEYGTVEISGRVIGPDDQPVPGATIFIRRYGVRVPRKKALTDANGRFKFTSFRRHGPKLTAANPNPNAKKQTLPGGATVTTPKNDNYSGALHTDESEILSVKPWLVATAPGFGFGTPAPGADVTIKMVADEPIPGRITDDKGNPIQGVRVRVRDVFWPRRADDPIVLMEDRHSRDPARPIPQGEGLEPWLTAISRAANMNEYFVARGYLISLIEWGLLGDKPTVYAPLIPEVTTDNDGRFMLKGLGRDRVAEVYVDGESDKASALIVIANRSLDKPILVGSETPRTKQLLTNAGADLLVFGNKIELALAPGRTLEGIVTDGNSGVPLAGMRVIGPTVTRLEYPGFDRFFATTDQQGHFRIDSFPVMSRARFNVETSDKRSGAKSTGEAAPATPYFGREMALEIKAGTGPQRVDFPLSKGIWITGKVVDDATGQGLEGETIEYHVFNANPFLQKDLKEGIRPEFDDNIRTNRDGTFRLRAYPGRGIVTAGGGHDYLEGIGADKIEGLKPDEFDESLYGLSGFSPYIRNTTIEVNVPTAATTYECELRLKKGKSRMVTVVGPTDDPVSDLEASGLANQIQNPISAVKNTYFDVTNLFPGENREVVARCVPQKLIGMAVVSESEQGPVTLKLLPWANLTGRLVDDAGQPRSRGLRIQLEDGKLPIHTLNGRNYDKEEFLIDPDGKFRIDGLVPGAKYRLQVVEGGILILGDATGDITLMSGETRDLGNVKVMKPKHLP